MPLCRGVWCGLCYSGKRGRQTYKGHYGYRQSRAARQVFPMPFVQRSAPLEAVPVANAAITGCDFAETYSALWEYLTLTQWPDGKPRVVSTLLVLVQDGMVKGCLNDKAQLRSLWVSGASYTAMLDALEGHLRHNTGDWRRAFQARKRGS